MDNINQRKQDHIDIVSECDAMDRSKNYFEQIRLIHRALPEIDLMKINSSTSFLGKPLSFPLVISSMTGGAGEELIKINQNLAMAAEAEGIGLAVGSQRILFSDPMARKSFELRAYAPNTLLLGNLGAVQLNDGVGLVDCEDVNQVLDADGFFLHLNPLQEAIQPEGDTNFSNLQSKIAKIVQGLNIPVIIKEVGAGVSLADIELLISAGVRYVDIAGSGGTSWSKVEGVRSRNPELGDVFADWGIPTPLALKMLKPYRNDITCIASGGIRSGIDMVKCMILGASVCGIAQPFLNPARESAEAVRKVIQRLKREFVTAMFLLGAGCISDIKGNEGLILNENWN